MTAPRPAGRLHPAPSSREHTSASASRTRRSLPDVGELAHTQFITAMLIALAVPCGRPQAQDSTSDPGSGMGADSIRQARSDALARTGQRPLTCVDEPEQAACTQARPADKEEAGGSSPPRPTHQARTAFRVRASRGPRTGSPGPEWTGLLSQAGVVRRSRSWGPPKDRTPRPAGIVRPMSHPATPLRTSSVAKSVMKLRKIWSRMQAGAELRCQTW